MAFESPFVRHVFAVLELPKIIVVVKRTVGQFASDTLSYRRSPRTI